MRERGSDLYLIPLVVSLFHIDKCTRSNSEPEKCYPIKRTIGSLLSWSKLNDIAEAHRIQDFIYTHHPVHLCERGFYITVVRRYSYFSAFSASFRQPALYPGCSPQTRTRTYCRHRPYCLHRNLTCAFQAHPLR